MAYLRKFLKNENENKNDEIRLKFTQKFKINSKKFSNAKIMVKFNINPIRVQFYGKIESLFKVEKSFINGKLEEMSRKKLFQVFF